MKDNEITDSQFGMICSMVLSLTNAKLQVTPHLDVPAFSSKLLSELIDAIECRCMDEQ